jgi:hypothetical protein
MTILAIDPGNTQSGYALIDADTRRPLAVGKIPNDELLESLLDWCVGGLLEQRPLITHLAIEMVASYGMAVGKEVFETCVWIGRFQQLADVYATGMSCELVYRRDVKLHHCHSAKAKDANIAQALIDRFASGQPNRGKGTKAAPGWFHGFAADMWQAYALAVLVADRLDPAAVAS